MAKFWRSYEPSLSIDKSQVDADPAWRGSSNRGRHLGNHGSGERSTRASGWREKYRLGPAAIHFPRAPSTEKFTRFTRSVPVPVLRSVPHRTFGGFKTAMMTCILRICEWSN